MLRDNQLFQFLGRGRTGVEPLSVTRDPKLVVSFGLCSLVRCFQRTSCITGAARCLWAAWGAVVVGRGEFSISFRRRISWRASTHTFLLLLV